MKAPVSREIVLSRLNFAARRLHDLLALGDLLEADASERDQLTQEFYFHLVSATDALAQLVNSVRGLGIALEDVSVHRVSDALRTSDPIKLKLGALHMRVKGEPVPSDPYSDEGYVFRLLNYRHQVSHRGRNPFYFRIGSEPTASLLLDPRIPAQELVGTERNPSMMSAPEELSYMFNLIERRCDEILELL